MAVLAAERVERPASLFGPRPEEGIARSDAAAGGREDGLGGRPTLDDAIVGVWEGLAARVVVACPVCGGALRPHAHERAAAGRCERCAATLE